MTKIVYFSGTGNSLDVARNIANNMKDSELVAIISLLNLPKLNINVHKLVIVYPIYLMTIPYPVRKYLESITIEYVDYIAAIATSENGGNLSHITINKLLKSKNRKLDYFTEIVMPQNSPTGIRPTKGDDDWVDKISNTNTNLIFKKNIDIYQEIAYDIINNIRQPESRIAFSKIMIESIISSLSKNNTTKLNFFIDETCVGCKICEKICPANRIEVSENEVVWNKSKKCYYCFACFNACPHQSILLKNYNNKDGRYINPNIELADLMNQKST